MEKGERLNVYEVYNTIATWFDQHRDRTLIERKYLDVLISKLKTGATVLDMGCGTGMPMLAYLDAKELKVTGMDASKEMLKLARINFPAVEFIEADMRKLSLNRKFDALIAWHSFFHLPSADQPAMFEIFRQHLSPEGILLFTSGTTHGEAWGMNGGENLFHASLDTAEYKDLLKRHNFEILMHVVADPECGLATVWMAQYNPE